MENSTAFGVSQAAISESNQHPSPGPVPERSSDPSRSSQNSLCSICAQGLRLDDRYVGPDHIDESKKIIYRFEPSDWYGGAQFEPRDITPPHLPELSDECKFCRAVKSIVLNQPDERESWQTTITKLTLRVQYKWKYHASWASFELVSLDVWLDPGINIQFPIAPSPKSCKDWFRSHMRPLDVKSPFSKKNVALIQSWLQECPEKCHVNRFAKQKFLPTRLLDVGAQGSNDLSITLVDTRNMLELRHGNLPIKYICLSYCWGTDGLPLRTTKATIESHKKEIPMDSMPRVFRDAVLVTRTLGIRYLWIDALCIIQGCHEDWHNESAAMADVFSHSWMTIGAATSSSCHETLFYPRQDLSIDIDFQSSIEPKITGTISILLLHGYLTAPLKESLKNSRWNTRGWVWQEQKLSPRLLIFGEKMLHLRCHKRMLHEYGSPWTDFDLELDFNKPGTPSGWEEVMHDYSRRELSKGSDRLAAMSGLVKSIAQKTTDPATFIAGIWLIEPPGGVQYHQLSWFLENRTMSFGQLLHHHSDPQQYIAPSWSWVALNQPVNNPSDDGRTVHKVVSHNIIPARSDATVAIAPGSSITLRGQLRRIPTRPSMGIKSSWSEDERTETWYEAPYRDDEQGVEERIMYYLDWDPSTEDLAESDIEADLKLFRLYDFPFHSPGDILGTGLILSPSVVDPSVFLRVGYFEICGPRESTDWEETEVVVI